MSGRNVLSRGALAMLLAALGGCTASNDAYQTNHRNSRGLVIILPGIEGVSPLNRSIRRGLVDAGVDCSMPIVSWGRPIGPAGMLVNQVDFLGNRIAAKSIARQIVDYQDRYPGRPVTLIGHSGGGGVAVFAAEALPPGRKIDGLVLLSASIGNGYDMAKALSHCRRGAVNFYNPDDVGLLGIGTTVLSNVDGSKGPSAGLTGFRRSWGKLHQIQLNTVASGGGDPHTCATRADFIARRVAPWVVAASWPPYAADRSTTASAGTWRPQPLPIDAIDVREGVDTPSTSR